MIRVLALAASLMLAVSARAQEDDHALYYYPIPATKEVYKARAPELPGSDRSRRIGFVTALTSQAYRAPYPPEVAIFAKGEYAEKLIIVSLGPGRLDTLFRMRALLAQMTAQARTTKLFVDLGAEEALTFFDLAAMLGFEQITVSDGDRWAHRVLISPRN